MTPWHREMGSGLVYRRIGRMRCRRWPEEAGGGLHPDPYPKRVSRLPTVDVLMGANGGAGTNSPSDIERAIARIAGIQASRVVTEGERIAEVHVLASRGRGAKQLVRDIQSVVLTNFGIDIDYRTVSVVQLEEDPGPAAAAATKEIVVPAARSAPRPALVRIAAETSGFDSDIRIGLLLDGSDHEGVARGPATSGLRLVAQAVIDAVKTKLNASAVEVEFADVVMTGQRQVAVAVLRILTGRGDHVVVGSALLRRDPNDAMAKAALDAVNRLVGSD